MRTITIIPGTTAMPEPLAGVLAAAAVTVGALHTLAPNHWMPFAALARAQRWPLSRTARVTAACGAGHVTVTVLLAALALYFGGEVLQAFGRRMESAAGLLLVGFGLVYGIRGLRRAAGHRFHGHHHHHYDHVHEPDRTTPWALFVLFSSDPCVALMPILLAAVPLGIARTLAVAAAYELATIAAMVTLALTASRAATHVRGAWVNRYGDAAAGGIIATVGLMVAGLGW